MDFDEFWSLYPRKVAKAPTRKVWERMTLPQRQAAITALPNHIRYWRASSTELQYIPHARTWLHQERWEDELQMPERTTPWWKTEQDTLAMAKQVGLFARAGESWEQLRQRITDKLRGAA